MKSKLMKLLNFVYDCTFLRLVVNVFFKKGLCMAYIGVCFTLLLSVCFFRGTQIPSTPTFHWFAWSMCVVWAYMSIVLMTIPYLEGQVDAVNERIAELAKPE